jgi:hypothetical protein
MKYRSQRLIVWPKKMVTKLNMKENKTRKIVALLILLMTVGYGQVRKTEKEKDTTRQWELGLDLLWLIDKNQVPSTSLFARYNFVNKKSKQRALRFRLGVDNSTYDSAQINDPRDNEIDIISPYLRVGYEWQREINQKSSYFFGVDCSMLFSRYKAKQVIYPGPNLYQVTDRTWIFGIAPIIGLKYSPLGWICISIESSLNLTYRIRREDDKITDINFPNSPGGRGKIDVNNFDIHFLPITVINLSFFLNKKY